MRHAAVLKFEAEGHKAKSFIEGQLVGLGSQVEAVTASGASMIHGGVDHCLGSALTTKRLAHCNTTDLDMLWFVEQTQCADHFA